MIDNDIVMETKDVMIYLRISRPTFLKLVAQGEIPAKKVGHSWRVNKSELDRMLWDEREYDRKIFAKMIAGFLKMTEEERQRDQSWRCLEAFNIATQAQKKKENP